MWTSKQRLILEAIGVVIGLPAWIYLFFRDWKMALALIFILWSFGIQLGLQHEAKNKS